MDLVASIQRQAVVKSEVPESQKCSVERLGLPKNWPKNVKFSSSLRFGSLNAYNENRTQDVCICGISLKTIADPLHPCKGQLGVFASMNFDEKHEFGQDAGKVITHGHEIGDHTFFMCYSKGKRVDYTIDAREEGNETRFVNDYRGIARAPNVVFDMKESPLTGHAIVVLISLTVIQEGEELLCDYGQDYWDRENAERKDGTSRRGEGPRKTNLKSDNSFQDFAEFPDKHTCVTKDSRAAQDDSCGEEDMIDCYSEDTCAKIDETGDEGGSDADDDYIDEETQWPWRRNGKKREAKLKLGEPPRRSTRLKKEDCDV
jgi:hypothetical protein